MPTATKKATELAGEVLAFAVGVGITVFRIIRHRKEPVVATVEKPIEIKLQRHAERLGVDPDYKDWAVTTRQVAMSGLPSEERIGKEELLRRKGALRES